VFAGPEATVDAEGWGSDSWSENSAGDAELFAGIRLDTSLAVATSSRAAHGCIMVLA